MCFYLVFKALKTVCGSKGSQAFLGGGLHAYFKHSI